MNAIKSFEQLSAVLFIIVAWVEAGCSRDRSRIVRGVIKYTLHPIYNGLGVQMPSSCDVYLSHDVYYQHEENKEMETPSKWVCNLCGKSFYDEHFLDVHFQSRHEAMLNTDADAVCLENWCDVFRCDVISGRKKPDYWDHALCRESDFNTPNKQCHDLMKKCVPPDIPHHKRDALLEKLDRAVCDYLNCDKYFDLPEVQNSHPGNAAIYAIAFMFLAVGVLVYYYIAYIHYYTNENIFDQLSLNTENKYSYYKKTSKGHVIRQRTKVFR